MKGFSLLTSILIAVAAAAASQTLTVRSGEHDGYTRLVVQVPQGTDWKLAQRKNGAGLSVAIEDATFQMDGVFGRLSSGRLSALSQTEPGATLDLEFGCDCVASAFLFQQSMIVVDIAPGALPPPLDTDVPLPRAERPMASAPLALPLLRSDQQVFTDQLSIRLLQGADREILDLDLAPAGPRLSNLPNTATLPTDLTANLNVTTVLEELETLLGADVPKIEKWPACIADAELGFGTWSDTRPFVEQMADLRTGLFQEFDRVDNKKAVRLAKLYAFHGFGAESAATLALLETQTRKQAWIAAIAAVVDEQVAATDSPFRGLQRCNGNSALWALLSEKELAADADLAAIEQSFAQLPRHLRRSLGPALSSILVDAGLLEPARRTMRSVDRVEPEVLPSVAKAQIAEAEGDHAAAEAMLQDVVSASETAQDAPLALARLVEKRWVNRGSVSSRERDLAAAFAVEFRGSEIEPMMQRTHVVALGLSHEFDHAHALIQSFPEGENRIDTLTRHLHLLTARADDITFLKQVLNMPYNDANALNTEIALALSDRLSRLGFGPQSVALANRPHDTANRSQRARLRARAALLDGQPQKAMMDLSDDASSEAENLRVQALAAIEDYKAAADLLRDLGDVQAANRYFWLADLPAEIDVQAGGLFAELNTTTQNLANKAERQPDTPLADARNLIGDSEAARQQITAMLSIVDQNLANTETETSEAQ